MGIFLSSSVNSESISITSGLSSAISLVMELVPAPTSTNLQSSKDLTASQMAFPRYLEEGASDPMAPGLSKNFLER